MFIRSGFGMFTGERAYEYMHVGMLGHCKNIIFKYTIFQNLNSVVSSLYYLRVLIILNYNILTDREIYNSIYTDFIY